MKRRIGIALLAVIWGSVVLRIIFPTDVFHSDYPGWLAFMLLGMDLYMTMPVGLLLTRLAPSLDASWLYDAAMAAYAAALSLPIHWLLVRRSRMSGHANE